MAAWTDPADVTNAWIGEGAPTDTALITTWIGKAERDIRYRVPDIQTRIDAEAAQEPPVTDLLDAAKDIVVAMVTRVFRNPDGLRSQMTVAGPYTEQTTFGGTTPGVLSMSEDELAKLSGPRSRGAFTIDLIPSTSPFYAGS